MALNHGINVTRAATKFEQTTALASGGTLFIGTAPVHAGKGSVGKPVLVNNYNEFVENFGWSDDWRTAAGSPKWTLCQAAYAVFRLFGVGPAVFINVYDPATNKTAVAEAGFAVKAHCATLPYDAIVDAALVVKTTGEGAATLVKGTDYDAWYDNTGLVIELLETGSAYSAENLNIAYNKADLTNVTATTVAGAVAKVDDCMSAAGIIPDLLAAPGWSNTPSVAAALAVKASSINGLFRAKAVVDLDCSATGANTVAKLGDATVGKDAKGYNDPNMIVCWPLVKNGGNVFDYSAIMCGLIGQTDNNNGGAPVASPSNYAVPISGCVDAEGNEINLNVQDADTASYTYGVVTALNYGGWRSWGNYTGAKTVSTDVAEIFIGTNRMVDYICNRFVSRYWRYVDRPLTRVLIDTIVNDFNVYLTGLTAAGSLYGGEIRFVNDNNPAADLIAGKFRLDIKVASPVPAQRIDAFVEFDVDTLVTSLTAAVTG